METSVFPEMTFSATKCAILAVNDHFLVELGWFSSEQLFQNKNICLWKLVKLSNCLLQYVFCSEIKIDELTKHSGHCRKVPNRSQQPSWHKFNECCFTTKICQRSSLQFEVITPWRSEYRKIMLIQTITSTSLRKHLPKLPSNWSAVVVSQRTLWKNEKFTLNEFFSSNQ